MRTPYYGVFAVKIFGGFWFLWSPTSSVRYQNQSRAAVLAHILSDPRLPAGPPNAVTRSRRKYHSVVAHSGYSVVKLPPTCPGISKAGRMNRRVFSESPDAVLLDKCPGSFEHPLPYASGFGSLVLPWGFLPHIRNVSAWKTLWPWNGIACFWRFFIVFQWSKTRKSRYLAKNQHEMALHVSLQVFLPNQQVSAPYSFCINDLLTPWIISYGPPFDSDVAWHFFGLFLMFFDN